MLLLLFPLKLHHLSHSPAQKCRLRLVPPRATSLPLCSCRRSSPYCYCCCCRCCVGATRFFLYRLLCPILAAGVLLVCYVVAAEVLLFFAIPSPGTTLPPPHCYPVLRYFLFVPPNSTLFRHSYIFVLLLLLPVEPSEFFNIRRYSENNVRELLIV